MRTVAVLLAVSTLWPAAALAEAEFVMTIATVAPAESPWAAVLTKFEKAVEQRTGGRIDIRPKLGGMLGDEIETVTKCRRGQIQAVGASTGAVASIVPELNVVELPYLFRSVDEADHVLDTVLLAPMEKLFRERGLILGFWSENGYRNFGTRDAPVRKPEDLKGKKMRVQESPVHMAMYKAYGAAAMPIPTTEVPQALATGNVDGFDQSALYAIAASWYKSIKYFTVSDHIYQPAVIAFNAEWFDKLPEDLRKVLIEEGRAIMPKGRKAIRQIVPDLLGMLRNEKIAVVELSAEEKAVFEKAAQPVYADFRKTQGAKAAELLDASLKALKKLRGGK